MLKFWTWIVGCLAFLAMLATGLVAKIVVGIPQDGPNDSRVLWALVVLGAITVALVATVVMMHRQWGPPGDYFGQRNVVKTGSGAVPRGVAGRDPADG